MANFFYIFQALYWLFASISLRLGGITRIFPTVQLLVKRMLFSLNLAFLRASEKCIPIILADILITDVLFDCRNSVLAYDPHLDDSVLTGTSLVSLRPLIAIVLSGRGFFVCIQVGFRRTWGRSSNQF